MNPKQKKLSLAFKQRPILALNQEERGDIPFNLLSGWASAFGFEQIVLSPVEERKILAHENLQRHFGSKILRSEGEIGEAEFILYPTCLLGALKKYSQNYGERGPHVSKWFYLLPVIDSSKFPSLLEHELGLMVLGIDSVLANAQLINAVNQILKTLGVKDFVFEVSSLGCSSCQKEYQAVFAEYAQKTSLKLCAECNANLENGALAVWNCDNEGCQAVLPGAPPRVDFLDETCRHYLVAVLEAMDELNITYVLNPNLYSKRISEQVLFRTKLEAQNLILGEGGSFKLWTNYLGAEGVLPALAFLATFEKLWEQIPVEKKKVTSKVEVFLIPLGEVASLKAMNLYGELYSAGIRAGEAMLGNSGIKNQLRAASEQHSEIALIIGQKEALDQTVILRDMRSGMQEVFSIDRIIEEVKKRLGR